MCGWNSPFCVPTSVLAIGIALASSTLFADELALEMYNAAAAEPAAHCKAMGINTLVVGNKAGLDLCTKLGLKGVFSGVPHKKPIDPAAIREALEPIKDHPALAGYILTDEPDLHFWDAPPEYVKRLADAVAIDSKHPTMVTCSGALSVHLIDDYQDAVDVLRLDPYPFFYGRPTEWAVEVLDYARAASGGTKKVVLIQQAWSADKGFPGGDFDRCLAFLALIHRAAGISHYAYAFRDRGKRQTLPEHEPEFFKALQCTIADIASLSPLADPPADARIICTSSPPTVHWDLRSCGDELLLLLCNPGRLPAFTWVVPVDRTLQNKSLFTHRRFEELPDGMYRMLMQPNETAVFRLDRPADAPPPAPSLIPVTLELVDLYARPSAYQHVLIHNEGDELTGCRLRLTRGGQVIHTTPPRP